nr:deleted in malignant brain tumors 1 protein-like [Lytechinus pictus]
MKEGGKIEYMECLYIVSSTEKIGSKHHFRARLVGGSNDAEGRVEVMYDGSWGTICDINWDLRDARVVCRMLGFEGALKAPRSARFGQGSGRVLLKRVECDGTENNLEDCDHRGVGDWKACGHERDAGATCYSGEHPNPLQVRLAGGSNDAEGRVEVLHDGSCGTICDDWWDLSDATVVCRMLGFNGALDAPGSAWFGKGSGQILLKYVNCEGTEDNLADCAHEGIGRYSCSHARDAGAISYSGDSEPRVYMEIGTKSGEAYYENRISLQRKTKKRVINKYRDMEPISQLVSEIPDTWFDSYLLPTSSSMPKTCLHLSEATPTTDVAGNVNITVQDKGHTYMDMDIVYQKPASGSDLDVDGYLLPDKSADTDQDIDGYLRLGLKSAKT